MVYMDDREGAGRRGGAVLPSTMEACGPPIQLEPVDLSLKRPPTPRRRARIVDDSRGEILRAPFYFSYENGADLNVEVIIKNKPADMDFDIYKWCSPIFSYKIHKGSDFFSLQSRLWCPKTRVSIELFSNFKGSYYKKPIIILEGRIDYQSNGMMAGQTFDHTGVCLDDSPCTIELDLKYIYLDDSRGEILRAPFYFYYKIGADLNVKVILKNKPADLDFRIHKWCSSILSEGIHKESDFFTLQSRLWCPKTIVFIDLFSNIKGSYHKKPIIILEGRTEDHSNGMMAGQTFDDTGVCLNYNSPCTIELDLKDIYPDSTKTPPKYGNNANGNNEATPPQHGNNATTTPRYGNNERTSEQTINYSISGTETKTYTVAIASAVSGIALVLLPIFAILAIKKRMEKDSSPATPRVQKNKVNNPFYVNLLFKNECAKEIKEIENHIYEEIKPQEVEVN